MFDVEVAGHPIVRLDAMRRRVRVQLVIPVVGRCVDVTAQPATPAQALRDAAAARRVDLAEVAAAAYRSATEAAAAAAAWTPRPDSPLVATFGGVAFPLLGALYDEGGSPLGEVPPWAEATLGAASLREAGVAAFGSTSTRPVRAALVEALRPLSGGVIDLSGLLVGLIGAPTLEPDRLAALLSSQRVAQRGPVGVDTSVLELARRIVARWGAIRAERVLREALERADGVTRLVDTVRYADWLGDHGPADRLPNGLDELHDVHRALLRSAPANADADAEGRPAAATPRRRRRRGNLHQPLAAPVGFAPVTATTALPAPPAVEGLDGVTLGELDFVVPRVADDLSRWGRLMSNCLGSFAPSVAAGRSSIIGVRRRNRLVYALEVTPARALRQFCGRANRIPDDPHRHQILEFLVERGVIDAASIPRDA